MKYEVDELEASITDLADQKYNYRRETTADQEVTDTYNYISWIQRSLLTELNGIERARYYLFSAHAELAWYSLILALFLDSVPILLMIIKVLIEKAVSQNSAKGITKLAMEL